MTHRCQLTGTSVKKKKKKKSLATSSCGSLTLKVLTDSDALAETGLL